MKIEDLMFTEVDRMTSDDYKLIGAAVAVRNKWSKVKKEEFNMNYFAMKIQDDNGHICGTAHCLGGWIDLELNSSDPQAGRHNPIGHLNLSVDVERRASALFFPTDEKFYTASRKRGKQALDNFINGANNPWKGVF